MKDRDSSPGLLCPSAEPNMDQATALGVVLGTVNEPRMVHLERPLPVTDDLLALSGPVKPTEVFRFAAPCAGNACKHFDGKDCSLVQRIVQILPRVTNDLPICAIRADCRWWQQEGKAACFRCPQVVHETCNASLDYARAAGS